MNYTIKTLTKTGKEKKVRVVAESYKEALKYLSEFERKHIVCWYGWKC